MTEQAARSLKPFQVGGAEFVSADSHKSPKGRRGLFMWMRLGKTPTSSKAAQLLEARRILVCCKSSGVLAWLYDGKAWLEQFTGLPVHIHEMSNTPDWRRVIWNKPTSKDEVHVYIVVYNTFMHDMGITTRLTGRKKISTEDPSKKMIKSTVGFDLVICDECRRISNRKTQAFAALRALFRDHIIKYFIPMSGTPGHYPIDFWTYLFLIDSKKFASYWAFAEHFMEVVEAPFGRESVGQRHDTKAEWDRLMNQYFWIIPEGQESAPVQRFIELFDMEDQQRSLYNQMREGMLAESEDQIIWAPNAMVQFLRLRQLVICPKILNPKFGYGGAIKHVAEQIEDDPHTIIFTPFTSAFEPFTEYLLSRGFEHIYHLRSGITVREQRERIELFRKHRGIVICSCKYAEAFSLQPAKRSWFIGYDEDPDINRQAENRAAGLNVADISAAYLTANTPTDIRMAEIVTIKQEAIDFSRPTQLIALLQGATNANP